MTRHRKTKRQPPSTIKTKPEKLPPPSLKIDSWFTTGRVVLLFFMLTIVMTFPLLLRINGWIMGDFPDNYSDIFAAIWQFWSAKVQLLQLHKSPFQFDLTCGPYSQSPIYAFHKSPTVMIPFTALFGPIASLNIFVMLNFALAGIFTWLLVRELTGSSAAGILPGIAFGFCPYAYMRAIAHEDLAPIWVLPLMLFALSLFRKGSSRIKFLVLALALTSIFIYSSPYYYLVIPMGLCCWALAWCVNHFFYDFSAGKVVRGAFGRISRRQWIIFSSISAVLLVGSASIYFIYLRPIAVMGARPLHWQERFVLNWVNYLVPPLNHPLWGKFALKSYYALWKFGWFEKQRNLIESSAFLGWLPLILAGYGLASVRRDWRSFAVLLFGLLALSLTFGPYLHIGGIKIPLPSRLLHEVAPFIRAIGRYAIFVMLAVAVLAGYGMKNFLYRPGMTDRKALMLVGMLSLAMAIEFAFPTSMMKVPRDASEGPKIYSRLLDTSPEATILEYPPVTLLGMPMADYFFYQTLHHRKLFNRYYDVTDIPEKFFPFWQDVDYTGSISEPATLQGLKYFGVDYIVYHDRKNTQWPHWQLPVLKNVVGVELAENFGRDKLYKITAPAAKALVFFETIPFYNYSEFELIDTDIGFTPSIVPEVGDKIDIGWRIMTRKGTIKVLNVSEKPQNFTLKMFGLSTSESRRIKATRDGQDLGEIQLFKYRPSPIKITGIQLEPGQITSIVLESLDGTEQIDMILRKINSSACFSYVEVISE